LLCCRAGCSAGAAATLVTYPLETLRTHMAVGGQSYRQCLSDIVKAHGHKGLYNGFVSGLVVCSLSLQACSKAGILEMLFVMLVCLGIAKCLQIVKSQI